MSFRLSQQRSKYFFLIYRSNFFKKAIVYLQTQVGQTPTSILDAVLNYQKKTHLLLSYYRGLSLLLLLQANCLKLISSIDYFNEPCNSAS